MIEGGLDGLMEIGYLENNFDIVLIFDQFEKEKLVEINEICRNSVVERKNGNKGPIGFIFGSLLGMFGSVFVDFGKQDREEIFESDQPKEYKI